MSSLILSLKTLISCSNLKCASNRRHYCHSSSASPLTTAQHLQMLGQSLLPKVVVLESHFTPPSNKYEIDNCPRLGTGFFLDPTLIATSIHVVARLTPSHHAHVARTLAFTHRGVVITTRPLALNFAKGVAVLEVLERSSGDPPPHGCALAEAPPPKDSILLAVSRHQSLGLAMMIGNVRGGLAAERKAPWPLDGESGWIEHGWFGIGIGDPAPGSRIALSEVSVSKIMGSPWFNLEGEVVGVASWDLKDEADQFSVGFAAPASSVREVADYVKTKGGCPLVMDTWIDAHVFYGDH